MNSTYLYFYLVIDWQMYSFSQNVNYNPLYTKMTQQWLDMSQTQDFFHQFVETKFKYINLISVFLITRQWLDMSYSGLWVLKNCRLRSFKILFASESFSFFTALKRPSKDTSFFGHFSIVYYRLWLWLQGFPYDKLFLGKKVIH